MEYIPSEKFTKRTTGAWYFPGAKVIKIRFVLKCEFIPFFFDEAIQLQLCVSSGFVYNYNFLKIK